jgi:hypothetical protein
MSKYWLWESAVIVLRRCRIGPAGLPRSECNWCRRAAERGPVGRMIVSRWGCTVPAGTPRSECNSCRSAGENRKRGIRAGEPSRARNHTAWVGQMLRQGAGREAAPLHAGTRGRDIRSRAKAHHGVMPRRRSADGHGQNRCGSLDDQAQLGRKTQHHV